MSFTLMIIFIPHHFFLQPMETDRDLTETAWRRQDFLQALSQQPKTKQQLMQELGYAEQTIYKRIRELKQQSLVKKERDRYSLTLHGHHTHQKHNEIEWVAEHRELLTKPIVNQNLRPELLIDAEIVERSGTTPKELMEFYDEKFKECTYVEAMTCTLLSPSRVQMYERYLDREETKIEGIFHSNVVEYLVSEHKEVLPSNIRSGDLTAWVTDNEIPFAIAVLDNSEVLIVVFESEGTTKGTVSAQAVVHSKSTPAVNWAKQKFKETKEKARKLNPKDVTPKN